MLSNLKCTRQCLKVTGQTLSLQRGVHVKTHYEVLNIPKTATADQIRKAYIKRCKELHPDRNINDPQNHNKMVRLNEAYQCLSKLSSKKDYDRKLSMGINITESYYPTSHQRTYTPPRPDAGNYGTWRDTYYGASREERAQRERDYYRRVHEEMEKDWDSDQQKSINNRSFNAGLVLFTVIVSFLAYVYIDYQTQRNMQRREVNRADRIYFGTGGSYPRPLRKRGQSNGTSDTSDNQETNITS